jgi:cell division protein FtsN
MRPLRADVSHRMRRPRPSIFSARWFRLLLGGGVAIVAALALGPPVAGWLLRPQVEPLSRELPPPAENPGPVRPAALSSRVAKAPEGVRNDAPPPEDPVSATTTRAPAAAPAPSAPAGVTFRVQVGAFLDHRNADRLLERLRGEGFEVVDRVVEQDRVLHRVLASRDEGEPYEVLLERLRTLGFTPELVGATVVVTAPAPLHEAVEASRRLRAAGVPVRLEKAVGAAAFRVVRVGRYATRDAAERARAELMGRGIDALVVRDP